MKKSILVVEDEISLCNIIEDTLLQNDFIVHTAKDGEEGIDKFYEVKPDLVLLDINLPKKNGWNVCSELRKDTNVPIIIMTARDSDFDELHGLELGADDYVTKPFNLKILLIRIKKHLKIDSDFIFKFKGLNLDFKRHVFLVDEIFVDFSKKELDLLKYFIINRNRILTREMLLNEIWGFELDVEDRTVDTLVKRVRKKIGIYSEHIKTIRGVGYSFDEV
ncbi:MAG: response regulator transcription factor [Fusobacteriaceae bacterium]